jgi:hypothetical protein
VRPAALWAIVMCLGRGVRGFGVCCKQGVHYGYGIDGPAVES